MVYLIVFSLCFVTVLFFFSWHSLLSCCSALIREIAPSRNIWKNSWIWNLRQPSRTTASARFYVWDLTTPLKRSCPGNLLERASPIMWSGCWFPVDQASLLRTSPAPLQTVPSQNPTVGIKLFEPIADFKPFFAASPLHRGRVCPTSPCGCWLRHPSPRELLGIERARTRVQPLRE